jgi:hypothetical protein
METGTLAGTGNGYLRKTLGRTAVSATVLGQLVGLTLSMQDLKFRVRILSLIAKSSSDTLKAETNSRTQCAGTTGMH